MAKTETVSYPRVTFHLVCGVDPTDTRNNCQLVYSIKTEGDKTIFVFPKELQPIRNHPLLYSFPAIISAVGCIKQRNKYRNVTVAPSKELYDLYFDEVGNARFHNIILEDEQSFNLSLEEDDESELVAAPAQQKSLQSVTKDAVINHFDGVKSNPNKWIYEFEMECNRLQIAERNRCVAMRLFMDDLAKEWYSATYKTIGISTWAEWKKTFIDDFGTKSFNENIYAVNYRFLGGSLSQYVIHKRSLLADVDIELNEDVKILLIIAGMPDNIRAKLEKNKIKRMSDLMAKINEMDRAPPPQNNGSSNNSNGNGNSGRNNWRKTENKNSSSNGNNSGNSGNGNRYNNNANTPYRNPNYKPCGHCEKVNRPGRFHAETECLTKLRPDYNLLVSKYAKNKNVRMVNNTEMEDLLNNENETKN
jgi:hypothetical protein